MKKILVIGATSGIGNKICQNLIKEYYLILTGRNKIELKHLKENLDSEKCEIHELDLTKSNEVENCINTIDIIDGLIFCAGVSEHTPVKFIKRKHFENTFEVNLFSPILFTASLLKNNKVNRGGSLVYLSSASTKYPYFGGSIYVASKSGLEGFVRTLAIELGSKEITANCICPVFVKTKMLKSVESIVENKTMEDYIKKHPFGIINPLDVVGTVSFLISEHSKTISGQSIMVGNLD